MPYQIKPVLYVIYISATPFLITFIALIHLNLFFANLEIVQFLLQHLYLQQYVQQLYVFFMMY